MSYVHEPEPSVCLPMAVEEIDAAWLTAALRTVAPEAQVLKAEVAEVMRGTCTKVWIDLEAQGLELPSRIMLKSGFEPHSREWWYMHETEVRGYLHILPELALPSPACYFAAYSDAQKQGVILMEDLVSSGAAFCHAQRAATQDETRRRLATLAAFHARSWRSSRFAPGGDWAWIQDVARDTRDYAQAFLKPDVWNHYVALPRGAAVARRFHDAAWLGEALEKLVTLSDRLPHCVVHGDTHSGNLYVAADGTPGFFDSLPGHAPPISEVSYHLVCALDIEDRRNWEADLVRFYLDELGSHGVDPPTFEQAMDQYAAFLARAYFIFIINASEFQKEAVNTAYTARISTAMLDHDTAGRIAAIR